jgi:hypothetical protein
MRSRAEEHAWLRLPSSWVRFLVVPVLCGLMGAGCYSNRHVPKDELADLRRGGWQHDLVLRDAMGRAARLGPNSDVRFLRADGNWTAWLPGGELCVSPTAVNRCLDARHGGLPWQFVQGVEVRNLDGVSTYFVVLGVVVLIAAVVIMVAAGGKGGGGGGGGGGLKLFGGASRAAHGVGHVARGTGRALAHGARVAANFSYRVLDATARGWAWYGPALPEESYVVVDPVPAPPLPPPPAPAPEAAPPAPAPAPEAAPPAPAPAPNEDGAPPPVAAAPPEAGPPLPPLPPPPPPPPQLRVRQPLVPLFDPRTTRRGKIRLVLSVDGGTDFTLMTGGTFGAFVGMRLSEVTEIGAGLRLHAYPERPEDTRSPMRTSPIAFGRILGHFDVDAGRRVGFPIGIDAGGGEAKAYFRIVLGIRVRVWDTLSLGFYPFNPTLTYYSDANRQRDDVGWFSFPSTLELMWTY